MKIVGESLTLLARSHNLDRAVESLLNILPTNDRETFWEGEKPRERARDFQMLTSDKGRISLLTARRPGARAGAWSRDNTLHYGTKHIYRENKKR